MHIAEPLAIFSAKLAWIVFALYWIVSAFKLKAVKQRESTSQRLQHLLPLGAAYILLLTTGPDFGWFSKRFVPNLPVLNTLGVALAFAGVAFAIWARRTSAQTGALL